MSDIDRIIKLIQGLKDEKLKAVEAEIPYYGSTSNQGKMSVKAVWK